MDFKYYDILSTSIVGVVIVAIINHLYFDDSDLGSIVYLASGYLMGYFINAIGSLLEKNYYKTINGMPSDKLLTIVEGQNWTGYKRVKFYEAENVIKTLKKELNDDDASVRKMFGCAMRKVNGCEDSRVPAFNAQYAWSRTILTTILIADIQFAFFYYDKCIYWIIATILTLISWNRFKERGYYYAREVLNEYLNQSRDPNL